MDAPIYRLPLELVDRIIDFLWDDRSSLSKCSLTCHAWCPASRYHLFETIRVASRADVNRIIHAITAPSGSSLPICFTRSLVIREWEYMFDHQRPTIANRRWAPEVLLLLAGRLQSLKSLTFEDVLWGFGPFPSLILTVGIGFLTGVVRLSLQSTAFATVRHFQRLVCAFPQLQDLHLFMVHWRLHLPEDAPLGSPADLSAWSKLHLRSVIFRLGENRYQPEILNWLASTKTTHTVQNLCIWVAKVPAPSPWSNILRALGGSLVDLRLELCYDEDMTEHQLNMQHSTGLRVLTLRSNQGSDGDAPSSHILFVLSQISPQSRLHELHLIMDDFRLHDPQRIRAVLRRPHFCDLRKLAIEYRWPDAQGEDHASWRLSLEDAFSDLSHRGVFVSYSVKRAVDRF